MLSNLPLDGLPPTELMTMDDLEARLGIKEPPATQRLLLAQKRLRRQLGKEPTHQQIANELGVSRESVGRTMRSLIIKPR
jgi:DNA-directed RNA polymerase specialized sigma subunit